VDSPLSRALIGSSESSLLVTLGDRHHLDGSMVIVGTRSPSVLVSGSCQACERLWAIHRDGVSKNESGCGRFTMMECQRMSLYRALSPCMDEGGVRPLRGCSNKD